MEKEDFIEEVKLNVLRNHAIRLSDAEAWTAIQATLQALAEQLTSDETAFVAAKLPPGIDGLMKPEGSDENFTFDEFFERVAEQAAVDPVVATYYVRAIFETLSEMFDKQEAAQLRQKLPSEFASLFERGAGDELEISL